jgi:hypothetical protein
MASYTAIDFGRAAPGHPCGRASPTTSRGGARLCGNLGFPIAVCRRIDPGEHRADAHAGLNLRLPAGRNLDRGRGQRLPSTHGSQSGGDASRSRPGAPARGFDRRSVGTEGPWCGGAHRPRMRFDVGPGRLWSSPGLAAQAPLRRRGALRLTPPGLSATQPYSRAILERRSNVVAIAGFSCGR